MGANATTFVPSYTSGEVLTAANLSVTNSGIPVFADSTARDNSFGGTGEKVLAEGQYAYLESTNATQVYDGATWQAVGASGLVYITGGTVAATASANFDSVFSATYDNYRVIISDIIASGSGTSAYLKMRVGGATNSAAAYTYQGARTYGSGTASPNGAVNTTDGLYLLAAGTTAANNGGACIIDFTQPFLAKPTSILCTSHNYYDASNSYFFSASGGTHAVSSSFDGFNISLNTTTLAFKYKIYGYANS